jgi:hypothetical protein
VSKNLPRPERFANARRNARAFLIAKHALRGKGKVLTQQALSQENSFVPVTAPKQRFRDKLAQAATKNLLQYQREYAAEQRAANPAYDQDERERASRPPGRLRTRAHATLAVTALKHDLRLARDQPWVHRLTTEQRAERTGQLLNPLYDLRTRRLAKRALRGDDQAVQDRFEVSGLPLKPEKAAYKRAATRSVAGAFGADNTLPLQSGYHERNRFNLSKSITAEIGNAVAKVCQEDSYAMSMHEYKSIKHLVPIEPGCDVRVRHFSEVFSHEQHVETVRNLFVAHGSAAPVDAYRYVRAERLAPKGLQRETLPDRQHLDSEQYLVGLRRGTNGNDFEAAGVVSLSPQALELLAIADATLRREPGEPLPQGSVSAITRVYDLVMADSAQVGVR